MSVDLIFMDEALKYGREALREGEVPIGCVFVFNGEVIARGRNTVNKTKNATRHAEINALDELFLWSNKQNISIQKVMSESVLYVTVEPCAMCADAVAQLELGKLVYGCSNDRFGGCGSVVDVFNIFNYSKRLEIINGVKAESAIDLLKEFYKGENPNAPSGKAKRKGASLSSGTS